MWTLSSSEVVRGIISQSYKGSRREDDLNQPLSVQSWGSDSDKRRYFLVEGLDDTAFRVYRESNPAGFNRTWWSVAGNIDELNALIDKLISVDGGPRARKLAQQMQTAVPRFEATLEKRKRREYRQAQKERFKRPEPGFSMYEGRTRGKRMKYTYSDDDEFLSDSVGNRRSARTTGSNTPAEPVGPLTTASGRQVKAPSRMTVDAANNLVTTSPEREDNTRAGSKESSAGPTGRPRRAAAVNHGTNGWAPSTKTRRGYKSGDDDEDESEPELNDDEDDHVPDEESEAEDESDEDVEMADEDTDLDDSPKSMVVKLKVPHQEGGGSKLDLEKFRYNGAGADAEPNPAEKGKTEDVISVAPKTAAAKKQSTPEPSPRAASTITAQAPPLTPAAASLQSTSLAYRESPDKLQHGLALAKPVGALAGE